MSVQILKSEAIKTWKLSSPIILGEITQMALALIDSAMVGAISYKYLAAASLANNVLNIPFIIAVGITISVSQLIATAYGRKDHAKISHYLFNGFILCFITSVLIFIGLVLSEKMLYNLRQDAEVVSLAIPYYKLMSISLIPTILFLTIKHFTDALEKTKIAMLLSILSIPVNIILNWLLIYGNWGFPKLGLTGAGIGTLITRCLILVALASVVFMHSGLKHYLVQNEWHIKKKTILELLHIGIPSSLQLAMELSAFAVAGIIIGSIGAVHLAAHQIAFNCAIFAFMVSLGLAHGSSIRVGHAWGKKDWHSINNIGKSTTVIGLCYGVLCAILFITLRHYLPQLFNSDMRVVNTASYLLIFAAVFQISDSLQISSASMLRGIKDVKIPTYYIGIAYWIIGIPLGYVLALTYKLGVYGMWIGFIAGLTFSGIVLSYRLKSNIKANLLTASLNHQA